MFRQFCVGLLLLAAGCASPIGVTRVGVDRAYQQITANTLNGPLLSDETRMVLARYGLDRLYRKSPDLAITRLHEQACRETRRDVLFALAEASYTVAQHYEDFTWTYLHRQDAIVTVTGKRAARDYYFASAVYAYLYLLGEGAEAPPGPLDPRSRITCDLYNRGLAKALKSEKTKFVELQARTMRLPMGTVQMESTRPGFPQTAAQFHQFVSADEFLVRGLDYRARNPGLGAPLIGIPDLTGYGDKWPPYYSKNIKVPVTAFLRVHGTVRDMAGTGLKATLELYSPFVATEAKVNGQPVALESDLTAPLAYALEGALVWRTELAQFLSGRQLIKSRIYMAQPYDPGKIPIVFVHGTTGSPAGWSEMFNALQADPVLRTRYQFWYFIYNSGQPILYSSMLLREGLDAVVKELDPNGHDRALQQMVVIGHSQGGLLTRLVASSTGGKVWGDVMLDQLKMSASNQALLRRCLVFAPSPYVGRAVFVCTPHRGSYRISGFVEKLARRMLTLPQDLVGAGTLLIKGQGESLPPQLRHKMPTSVSNMEPGSPFCQVLAECPFSPNIKRNSIIAVKPGMDIPTGNDTVVAYQSAHLDDVESEYVVRWTHSCQGQPLVIEEVRRILLQDVATSGR